MIRILVLSNMYPPHYLGGYELMCRDAVEQWRHDGHSVSILTTTFRVDGADAEADNRVWRDLDWYWHDHELVDPPFRARLAIEHANHHALATALDATTPDVVSVWNMGAMSLGLLSTVVERGIPLVFCVCDEWPLYAPDLDAWGRRYRGHPLLAKAVRRLTGVPTTLADLGAAGPFCFISDRTRRRAEELGPWKLQDSTVVYSGVDQRDFPVPAASPPPRPWSWRLLYSGRIDERKGIETAIRAVTHLPTAARLAILGRGDRTRAPACARSPAICAWPTASSSTPSTDRF